MDIGQKLKDKRTQAGLTQEAVAEKIGVSRQTVSNWENNRSYPDIVSVLRLSDLYEVSLDEFLKEDANMRKHVEENAQTLKRIWNVLAELSVLLWPVAIFIQHYNWNATATVLYILSALLYAVPRLFVPKLFGGSWKLELLHILEHLLFTGWMALGPYTWEKHNYWSFHFFILFPISWLSHYVWQQDKKAGNPTGAKFSWTTLTLLFAVLLFIFVADSDKASDQAEPNPYTPLPDTYQVAEVLHGDLQAELPMVKLTLQTRLRKQDPLTSEIETYLQLQLRDSETEEILYTAELNELEVPAGVDALKGIWQTTPEETGSLSYQITVEANETVTLSCYQGDSLQWKYRLRPTDRLKVVWKASPNLMSVFEAGYFNAGWFPMGESREIDSLSQIESLGKISLSLVPNYPADSLTVYEDYYQNGALTTKELTLQPDENGLFRLKADPYDDSGTRYSVYRIPFNDGEFVFVVNFP